MEVKLERKSMFDIAGTPFKSEGFYSFQYNNIIPRLYHPFSKISFLWLSVGFYMATESDCGVVD